MYIHLRERRVFGTIKFSGVIPDNKFYKKIIRFCTNYPTTTINLNYKKYLTQLTSAVKNRGVRIKNRTLKY